MGRLYISHKAIDFIDLFEKDPAIEVCYNLYFVLLIS